MALLTIDLFVDQYASYTSMYPPWAPGGVATNFAGATAKLMARVNPSDASPVVSISTTPSAQGSIVFGPVTNGPTGTIPAGCVQVNISSTQTAAMTAVLAYYDLEITFPNGTVTAFATGRLLLRPGNVH